MCVHMICIDNSLSTCISDVIVLNLGEFGSGRGGGVADWDLQKLWEVEDQS